MSESAVVELSLEARETASEIIEHVKSLLEGLGESGEGIAGKLETVGAAAAPFAAVGAAVGGTTIAVAALGEKYDDSMKTIQASGELTQSQTSAVQSALIQVSDEGGASFTTLAAAVKPYMGVIMQLPGAHQHVEQSTQQVVQASKDLSESMGVALPQAMQTVTSVMQAYQLPAKQAGDVSNQLADIASKTGVPVSQLGDSFAQMKMRLGTSAPTVTQTGALLEDLASHGVSGSRGIRMVSTGLESLGAPSTNAATWLQILGVKTHDASGNMLPLNQIMDELGTKLKVGATTAGITQQQFTTLGKAATSAQKAIPGLTEQQGKLNTELDKAKQKLQEDTDKYGPNAAQTQKAAATVKDYQQKLSDLTTKLDDDKSKVQAFGAAQAAIHDPTHKMTQEMQQQALAAIFGKSAAGAFSSIIEDTPGHLDAMTSALSKSTAAEDGANAKSQTLDYQMERLKNNVENAGAEIGEGMVPSLVGLTSHVAGAISDVSQFAAAHTHLTEAVLGGVAVIGTFAATAKVASSVIGGVKDGLNLASSALSAVQTGFTTARSAVSALANSEQLGAAATRVMTAAQAALDAVMDANPVVLVAIAIAALVAGMVVAYHESATFRRIVHDALEAVKDAAVDMKNGIVDAWHAIEQLFSDHTIATTLADLWDSVKSTAQAAWDAIKSLVTSAVDAVKSAITGAWNTIKSLTSSVWDGIKSALSAVFDWLKSTVTSVWDAVKTVITGAWNAIKTETSTVWDTIKTAISTAWTTIKTTVSTALSTIKTDVSTAWTTIKTDISTALDTIKTAISGAWTTIKTDFSTGTTTIKTAISTAFDTIKTAVSTALSTVKTDVSGAWTTIKSDFSGGVSDIKTLWTGAWNAIETTISGAVGKVRASAESVLTAVKNVFSGAATILFSIGEQLVDGLANGIESAVGGAVGAAENLASQVKNAVSGVLSIFSPSRVAYEQGQYYVQGLINAIDESQGAAASSGQQLALGLRNSVTSALSGGVGLSGTGLSALGAGGNVQITVQLSGTNVFPNQTSPGLAANTVATQLVQALRQKGALGQG